MPAGVKDALVWAVHKYGGKEEVDAKEYVRRLESEGRIYEECWS
jgi:sulfite reductase alpha subunit-like flavoprotein